VWQHACEAHLYYTTARRDSSSSTTTGPSIPWLAHYRRLQRLMMEWDNVWAQWKEWRGGRPSSSSATPPQEKAEWWSRMKDTTNAVGKDVLEESIREEKEEEDDPVWRHTFESFFVKPGETWCTPASFQNHQKRRATPWKQEIDTMHPPSAGHVSGTADESYMAALWLLHAVLSPSETYTSWLLVHLPRRNSSPCGRESPFRHPYDKGSGRSAREEDTTARLLLHRRMDNAEFCAALFQTWMFHVQAKTHDGKT